MANEHQILALVRQIYDNALTPPSEPAWARLVVDLERHVPGSRAILMLADHRTAQVSYFQAPHYESSAVAAYGEHFAAINPWWSAEVIGKHREGTIHSAEMLVPEQVLLRTEFYCDWLKPQGLHSGGGCVILRDNTRLMALSFLKPRRLASVTAREFELMRQLLPHLRRSAQIRRKFGEVALKASWETHALDQLPFAIVLLRPPGKIVHMNRAAASLLKDSGTLYLNPTGSLHVRRTSDDIALSRLIDAILRPAPGEAPSGGVLTIAGTENHAALSVLVAPFNPSAEELAGTGPFATLFIVPQGHAREAPASVLRILYGLSSAEAQVLSKLVAGAPIRKIAITHGVAVNTVRNQVQHLLAKLGAHRQSDLISRALRDLGSLAWPDASAAQRAKVPDR